VFRVFPFVDAVGVKKARKNNAPAAFGDRGMAKNIFSRGREVSARGAPSSILYWWDCQHVDAVVAGAKLCNTILIGHHSLKYRQPANPVSICSAR